MHALPLNAKVIRYTDCCSMQVGLLPLTLPPWLTLPVADHINQPNYAIATRACSDRSSLITTKC
jgi:hypothetical protein